MTRTLIAEHGKPSKLPTDGYLCVSYLATLSHRVASFVALIHPEAMRSSNEFAELPLLRTGSSAIDMRPVTLRPRLSTGLPFSVQSSKQIVVGGQGGVNLNAEYGVGPWD